jgi:undecaprenyl-diphosphatase
MLEGVQAALLGLVEGLTEFLPISSTGHMILVEHLIGFDKLVGKELADTLEIFIQLGAVLAIVLAYPERLGRLMRLGDNRGFSGLRGIGLLALTSIPISVVGLVVRKWMKEHLFHPVPVAAALLVGGLWILAVEWFRPRPRKEGLDAVGWKEAFAVGLYQCLALWSGMSRSASTILGGMLSGLDRKTATEYSFFAALVVVPAASMYELYKSRSHLSAAHVPLFIVATVVAFLAAWATVRPLVRFVSRHTLSVFGWYRLLLAALVFALMR